MSHKSHIYVLEPHKALNKAFLKIRQSRPNPFAQKRQSRSSYFRFRA